MKRHVALQNISREHQHTLSIAQQIIRAVQANDSDLMNELEKKIQVFYDVELKPHFKQEEDTLFKIIFREYPQYQALATTYVEEHSVLCNMVIKMKEGATSRHLEDFAILLKSHTRREERELFPLIEKLFTEQQLQTIQEASLQ